MKIFADHDSRMAALERKVGLFIFAGIGALVLLFVVIAIEQGMFASTTKLRLHTDDASNLHDGMEIRLSGFKVGKLVKVVLRDDGMIEATLSVDNEYLAHIRRGAKLRLVEQGLLGDSILEVIPGDRGQPALTAGEVLPFERQLGMDALAHDLVERLKPILDNLKTTTAEINRPDGLLQHAKSVAVQVEKASVTATELMRQTENAIATNNLKLNQVLDKTDALLVKGDGVLANAQKITSEIGEITTASSADLVPMIRDGRVVAEDARNIISSSKAVWPIRNFIDAGGEKILPMDSYGAPHVQGK
jgi:phospholipid/cholesterol/gamma-HCH transport system substrate-binding protein